jgi:hypothetical protein
MLHATGSSITYSHKFDYNLPSLIATTTTTTTTTTTITTTPLLPLVVVVVLLLLFLYQPYDSYNKQRLFCEQPEIAHFIMETVCVLCEVGNELLYTTEKYVFNDTLRSMSSAYILPSNKADAVILEVVNSFSFFSRGSLASENFQIDIFGSQLSTA